MVLSIDSLFDLSENTWISLSSKNDRNSRKSVAAFAFDHPYGAWILLQASTQVLVMAYGGICSGLTCSIRGKESRRCAKHILPFFVHKNYVL